MSEDPQLDLRVVGRQEQPAGLARDERLADLAAVLGADRNILEVGVARAQPAGRRDALIERRVNAAVLGMHQLGECVQVGALELRELAMLASKSAGNGCLSASSSRTSWAVLCSPPGVFCSDGSFSSSKSTWRSCGPELMLNVRPASAKASVSIVAIRSANSRDNCSEPLDVDRHSGRLHPRQHRDQGALELGIKVHSPSLPHLGRQDRLDPPGRVGILAGILGDPLDGDLVHPSLVLPFADQVGDRNHGVVEQALGQLVEVVVALAAFEQVAEDHRVGERAVEVDARALSASMSYLIFWPTFSTLRVAQDGPQAPRGSPLVEQVRSGRPAHRQVIGLARLPAKRQPDQIGPQGVDRGGLGVDAKPRLLFSARPGKPRTARAYRRCGKWPPSGSFGERQCRCCRGTELVTEPVEPAFGAEAFKRLDVGRLGLEHVPIERRAEDRRAASRAAERAGGLGVLAKTLLFLGPLHLVDIGQKIVERAELLEKRGREALADPGHAGDVVDGVAGQRQEIDDLVGADAPFLLKLDGVHELVLAQVEDADLVADQLAGVLVGGDDEDVESAFLGSAGKGRDDVVGLHPGSDEHRDPKTLESAADHRDLRHQVDRHFLAVRLVVLRRSPSETPAGPVEGRRQVIGLAVPDQVQKVAKDPEDSLRRLPGRALSSRGIAWNT